ncbi:MAG: hypothetical protein JNM45_13595 [Rhizobiales bacterium]|nr:hypothetical protein [Hyphomicrobiales bacterium]
MKAAVLAVGAVLAVAVSGPTAFKKPTQVERIADTSEIVVPGWLELPSKPFISSIEYSGQAGAEAAFGTILYSLPTNGTSEVQWIEKNLKAKGFAVDDRTAAIDNFAGADVVITATELVSGRKINLVGTTRMDGSDIRITFEDPTAGSYVSLL